MEHQDSAVTMVFNQLNHNTIEQSHSIKSKSNQTISSKKTIKRSSLIVHQLHPNIEEKKLQSTDETFTSMNKQNKPHPLTQHSHTSNLHLHTISDEKTQQTNQVKIIQIQSRKSKNKSVIALQSILQNQPYVKKLTNYLAAGYCFTTSIFRQKSLFAFNAVMMIKDQQMMRFRKISQCLSNNYQIISQSHRQNQLGFMKSNLTGSIFNIYQLNQLNEQKLIGTIYYEDQFSFKSTPRSIEMYILRQNQIIQEYTNVSSQVNLKQIYQSGRCTGKIIKLRNKIPHKNSQDEYVMDFGVNYIIPSVKNVILQCQTTKKDLIKFYKTSLNQFQLKICQNISPFIGYCFALSSLTFKLACQ